MPDLNSVPPSPHSLRGQAAQMPPPPAATAATPASNASPTPNSSSNLNILPSNQQTVNPQQANATAASSSVPSPQLTAAQLAQPSDGGAGAGPGPLRHPRPLTAAELHMQLEKEQEAVVNRLTRELTLLRAAHNASVASNASSASAGTSNHEPIGDSSLLSGAGFSIPSSRRHHRTSSTTSQTTASQLASSYEGRHRAGTSSLDPSTYFHQQRVPPSISSVAATPSVAGDQLSPGLMPGTSRYEETAFYRNELETAKKENEALKKKIRDLERAVRERQRSASRPRSESVSTTASASVPAGGGSSIAGPRSERGRNLARQSVASVGVGVPEDEVKVGESAASAGLKPGGN